MKTNKPMRKALILALAVMFVFALSGPAAAQSYFTATDGYYLQGTAPTYSNTTIHVNLVLESRRISGYNLYKTIAVDLNAGGTPRSFCVRDVLLAVQGVPANNVSFNDVDGNPIDGTKRYVYSITDKVPNPDRIYAPTSRYAWNGWMFRINGQFPLETLSPKEGVDIVDAYVTDGDTIHFYHDDGDEDGEGAYYVKIASVTDSGDELTVNVKASFQYYIDGQPIVWQIDGFDDYEDVLVKVYDADDNHIDGAYTDENGEVTLDISELETATCKVIVDRTFFTTIDYQNGLIWNTADEVVYTP